MKKLELQKNTQLEHLNQYLEIKTLLAIAWLLLLSGIAFFWHLGSTGLVDETEPMFAEAARQMMVTGDWITPYFNEATRFDKPPLIYWLMVMGYKLTGVNTWGARLPSAISAIALTFFAFYTLKRFGFPSPATVKMPEKEGLRKHQTFLTAVIGGTFLILNAETIVWAHAAVSDMLLNACIGSALLCFFIGYVREEARHTEDESISTSWFSVPNAWYIASYIFLALAVLTKGPVGLVLPGLIVLSFIFYIGKFGTILREMGIIVGALIFLAITVPWYVLIVLRNSDYIETFFGYHNVERFTSVVNQHAAPWYLYFLVVLVGFGPWAIYFPLALARLRFWKPSFWQRQPRVTHLGIFALFWFACIFIFFTVAVTKIPSYVLPLMPAVGIILALLWSEILSSPSQGKGDKGLLVSGIANVILLLIVAGAIAYSPNFIGFDPATPTLPERLAASQFPLIGAGIWALTAVAIAVLLFRPQYRRWLLLPNLIGFLAFIIFVLTPANFLFDEVRQLPLRQLAETIVEVKQPQEDLLMIAPGHKKASLVFYTQNPVEFIESAEDAIAHLQTLDPSSVLIVSQPNMIREMQLSPQDYEILDTKGTYQLYRLNPQVISYSSK